MLDFTKIDQAAQTVDDIINAAIFELGVVAAKAELVAALPWIAYPGISQLTDLLLSQIGKFIYTGLSNFAAFEIINVQVGAEQQSYAAAETTLRTTYDANNDPIALASAIAAYKTSLAALVQWDGDVPVASVKRKVFMRELAKHLRRRDE